MTIRNPANSVDGDNTGSTCDDDEYTSHKITNSLQIVPDFSFRP